MQRKKLDIHNFFFRLLFFFRFHVFSYFSDKFPFKNGFRRYVNKKRMWFLMQWDPLNNCTQFTNFAGNAYFLPYVRELHRFGMLSCVHSFHCFKMILKFCILKYISECVRKLYFINHTEKYSRTPSYMTYHIRMRKIYDIR